MRLAEKLISYLHSAFDKSPKPLVAFRARHLSDAFRYVIKDFTLQLFDGDVLLLTVDLNEHTLLSLVELIGRQNGMSVTYLAPRDDLNVSAAVLLEGAHAQIESNGDVFQAYSSLLWSYMESVASALTDAKNAIYAMLDQMSIRSADAEWLDEWGSYFGVPRFVGEADAVYSRRIIIEVMRPRGNNKAIELALLEHFNQESTVVDITKWKNATQIYNSTFIHNGGIHYDANNDPIYGLFQVVIGYDLESGLDPLGYAAEVRAFIEKFRDAGTHLESLNLSGSTISDTLTPPVDTQSMVVGLPLGDTLSAPADAFTTMATQLSPLADTLPDVSDVATLNINFTTRYNGARLHNGDVAYASGASYSETLP